MKQRKRKEFHTTGMEIVDPDPVRSKSAKPKRQSRKQPLPKLTREVLDNRIAQTLHFQIKQFMNVPFNFGAAQITNTRVVRDNLEVSIRMPFWLPPPTKDLSDWLGTPRAVKQVRQGFLRHLLSKKNFPRLSNLFYEEYKNFVYGFIGVFKFGENIVELIPPIGERHNAGRPRQVVEEIDEIHILNECKKVFAVLNEIKQQIQKWRSRTPVLSDKKCEERIRQQYPKDRFPWIRFFLRLIQGIPVRRDRKGNILHGHLSIASSWSALDLAVQVAQEIYYRETGIRFPARKFRKRIHPAIPS
jgi:hypothetical protein